MESKPDHTLAEQDVRNPSENLGILPHSRSGTAQVTLGSPLFTSNRATDNYAFVMNIEKLTGANSFTLVEGCELRRANRDEIAELRFLIASTVGFQNGASNSVNWERYWPVDAAKPAIAPEAEWRYFVISFNGYNGPVVDLSRAFDLSRVELEVGCTVFKEQGVTAGVSLSTDRLFQTVPTVLVKDYFVQVGPPEIAEITEIYHELRNHDQNTFDLLPHVARLGELKTLPRKSELRFLGYFALLESLLTHKPKPTDPYESITRQITQKIALLYNRSKGTIDYSPFGNTTPNKLWKQMYACRSSVAHGDQLDFRNGDLRVLKSYNGALRLIRETVKTVIRHALREPRLIVDLREC